MHSGGTHDDDDNMCLYNVLLFLRLLLILDSNKTSREVAARAEKNEVHGYVRLELLWQSDDVGK